MLQQSSDKTSTPDACHGHLVARAHSALSLYGHMRPKPKGGPAPVRRNHEISESPIATVPTGAKSLRRHSAKSCMSPNLRLGRAYGRALRIPLARCHAGVACAATCGATEALTSALGPSPSARGRGQGWGQSRCMRGSWHRCHCAADTWVIDAARPRARWQNGARLGAFVISCPVQIARRSAAWSCCRWHWYWCRWHRCW